MCLHILWKVGTNMFSAFTTNLFCEHQNLCHELSILHIHKNNDKKHFDTCHICKLLSYLPFVRIVKRKHGSVT